MAAPGDNFPPLARRISPSFTVQSTGSTPSSAQSLTYSYPYTHSYYQPPSESGVSPTSPAPYYRPIRPEIGDQSRLGRSSSLFVAPQSIFPDTDPQFRGNYGREHQSLKVEEQETKYYRVPGLLPHPNEGLVRLRSDSSSSSPFTSLPAGVDGSQSRKDGGIPVHSLLSPQPEVSPSGGSGPGAQSTRWNSRAKPSFSSLLPPIYPASTAPLQPRPEVRPDPLTRSGVMQQSGSRATVYGQSQARSNSHPHSFSSLAAAPDGLARHERTGPARRRTKDSASEEGWKQGPESAVLSPSSVYAPCEPTGSIVVSPPTSPSSVRQRSSAEPQRTMYELVIRQHPQAARACGFGERDRRAIDPPPIVQLIIRDRHTGQVDLPALRCSLNTLHCTLLDEDGTKDETIMYHPDRMGARRLMGQTVASPAMAKDEQDREGCFFCFPDLSCRTNGRYRLRFMLVNSNPNQLYVGGFSTFMTEAISDVFTVYSAKDFPGMKPSSALTRALKLQGCNIQVKKGSERATLRQRAYDRADLRIESPAQFSQQL